MFAKVFNQIFDSSIAEDYNCRRMFMDLLVLADQTGGVDMTAEAISRRTNVPIEEVQRYISELCQPDAKSRSQLEEGKRLVPLDKNRDWGWRIVNYQHYRNLRDEEARRSYFRDAMRKSRARKKKEANIEEEAEARSEQKLNGLISVKSVLNTPEFASEWDEFLKCRKAKRKPVTPRAAALLLTRLETRPGDAVAALQMAIENGWTGFKWHWFDQQNEIQKPNGQKRERKKPAPTGEAYQRLPEAREVSDEERGKYQKQVRGLTDQLREQFKMPNETN